MRVPYNPNHYFFNSKPRTAAKIDAKLLQYLEIHVDGVWYKIRG